jgi:hypothetical protein
LGCQHHHSIFVELVRKIADARLVRKKVRNRRSRENGAQHPKASRSGWGFYPLGFRANAFEIGGSREHCANLKQSTLSFLDEDEEMVLYTPASQEEPDE